MMGAGVGWCKLTLEQQLVLLLPWWLRGIKLCSLGRSDTGGGGVKAPWSLRNSEDLQCLLQLVQFWLSALVWILLLRSKCPS